MTIQMVNADHGMCGQIRVNWPAQYLQVCGLDIINSRRLFAGFATDAYFVQRCAEKKIFDILAKTNATRIIDFDDMLFKLYGEELPDFNFVKSKIDLNATTEALQNGLQYIDKVTVSTDYLKKAFIDNFNYDRVEVIPNLLPRWIFHFDRKPYREHSFTHPTILFAGSTTHFGDKGLGDFTTGLVDYLHNEIDNINLIFIGKLPHFLEDVKDKVTVLPYVDVLQYPEYINSIGADFIIAPLKECVFNKCKSNLKYLEACAIGSVLIGSVFEDSPYSMIDKDAQIQKTMTSKHIKKLVDNLCDKDVYNRILDKQYTYINSMWLENNIEKYANLFKCAKVKV